MSVFEPLLVRKLLALTVANNNDRKKFEQEWDERVSRRHLWRRLQTHPVHLKVNSRVASWKKSREDMQGKEEKDIPAGPLAQLKWEAHVAAYVQHVYKSTTVHANNKKNVKVPILHDAIPIYGPRFVPPGYHSLQKRNELPSITPATAYLKPLNIVHPFYYPELAVCPECRSHDVLWDEWTSTGHRDLHGLRREETALGYQLRCKPCEKRFGKKGSERGNGQYCFATTSAAFWTKWEYWDIPRTLSKLLKF